MTTTLAVILGFDISPRRIAMAAIDPDSEQVIHTTTATVPYHDDLRMRRQYIMSMVGNIRAKYDIIAIFIEDAYPGRFKSTIVPHAISVGNCEAFLLERAPDTLVMRLSPAGWRSKAELPPTGKEPILTWAIEKTGRGLTQDEADAIGIAVAGARIWNENT